MWQPDVRGGGGGGEAGLCPQRGVSEGDEGDQGCGQGKDAAAAGLRVEFHDIAVHHALYLANTDNCTMAALSSKLLDLASPKKVTVNYFSGDVIKEWSIEMGQEEEPLLHPLHRLPPPHPQPHQGSPNS